MGRVGEVVRQNEKGGNDMRLTISRERWLRGEPNESWLLRPEDRKMCCLGFLALACGATEEQITERATPMSVHSFPVAAHPVFSQLLRGKDNAVIAKQLMTTNDDNPNEEKLTTLFWQIGVDVEFVP